MPAVLTATAVLVCPHGGPLTVRASQHRLTVDGQPALVRADLFAATIACPNQAPKCTSVLSVDAGLAASLRVSDEPVALQTVRGSTNAGSPWHALSAGQTKLEAT
jgi:hypothetical protein